MNPALKHAPIDKWSTREKLSLASSVLTAGDQNWYSVSRQCKPFGELNRPSDWFSQKNCALQYNELLENVETPKRKRGEKNEDTAQNLIVRKLTMERINELKDRIEKDDKELEHFKKNISLLKNDNLSETDLKIIENQMLEALKQAKKDEEDHEIWLKERADKYAAFSRKKSIGLLKTPRKDDSLSGTGSVPSTPTKTPTTTTPNLQSLVSSQDQDSQTNEPNKNQLTIDDKHKVLKLEDILTCNQDDVSKTKDKQNKDELLNIIVINEDTKKQSTDSAGLLGEDKQVKDTSDKNKVEITIVQSRTLSENMDVDSNLDTPATQKSSLKSTTKDTVDKLQPEIKEEKEEQNKEQSESIASNKRKRTSTSISISTPTNVTTPTTTTNVQQPTTPLQTQTRRSGRIKPTTRTSTQNASSVTITPKLETSVVEQQTPQPQQQKKPDELNIIQQSTLTTNQALLNDESTKDSTTSDLTDTYTSPNSPASSILNIDHSDPEKAKEHKEYKAWKKAIIVLWRQASTHKYSSLFMSPVTDEDANDYSSVVYKPIDLTMIRKKIENGEIRTTQEFQRDIMLMFQNAIMYNSASHEVHQMAVEMQKEMLESIEDFIQHQKEEKNASTSTSQKDALSTSTSSRRKSRTT